MKNSIINSIANLINGLKREFNNAVVAKGQDSLLVSSKVPFGTYPQTWNEGFTRFRAKFNTFKEYPSTS